MNKPTLIRVALALALLGATPATATDLYPWNNHAEPFIFLFGNEIDLHQQSRLTNRGGDLFGYFYIGFTGVVTKDGYDVASHADCNANPCTVGWTLDGKPRTATLLYHVEADHPVFLINRLDIPEPGAYAHFHWLDYGNSAEGMPPVGASVPGYLLQLTAVDTFCFIHHGADSARKSKSCRDNGGIAVNPGIDIATHLNIVTSFE